MDPGKSAIYPADITYALFKKLTRVYNSPVRTVRHELRYRKSSILLIEWNVFLIQIIFV